MELVDKAKYLLTVTPQDHYLYNICKSVINGSRSSNAQKFVETSYRFWKGGQPVTWTCSCGQVNAARFSTCLSCERPK